MPDVVIVGLGPCGLGAAVRLQELGIRSWLALEPDRPGGLAKSIVDEAGFTWDIGGHVLFSHYEYFDRVVNDSGVEFVDVKRKCKVIFRQGQIAVDYPIQNHVNQLPEELRRQCEPRTAASSPVRRRTGSMKDFGICTFGEGLYDFFFDPYNRKVWAHPLEIMSSDWVEERVAPPKASSSWGPNNNFRYVRVGGIGGLYDAIFLTLPEDNSLLKERAVRIHWRKKQVELATGKRIDYGWLISTQPLKELVRSLVDADPADFKALSSLKHSSTKVVGVAFEAPSEEARPKWHWAYFPESDCPFYRCLCLSNIRPVPNRPRAVQLQFEVSESEAQAADPVNLFKSPTGDELVEEVIESARRYGLIPQSAKILSRWFHRVEYGYPVPTMGMKAAVLEALRILRDKYSILSRGRFGAWMYEYGNMDHSFMQGVEAVNVILQREGDTVLPTY